MDRFLQVETLYIELLLVVSLVAIAVRRLRVPYVVALVLVGLPISLQGVAAVELTPELILALFLPPLVFEAALRLNLDELRRALPAIVALAVPGVLLTALIVGGLLAWVARLAPPLALVFGALIAATDPVAVVALFRTLGVPKRLGVLVEGESLLNDGTAIVLFDVVLAAALTGGFDAAAGALDFVRVGLGGVLTGLVLGWLAAQLIARVDDYLIETTLTTVLAFGAYLVGERLHVSGVLAVVAAGLVNGNAGTRGMSPTTRLVLFTFWEYAAFLANSVVFLLIGLQVDVPALLAAWRPVLWAILAVLVARAVVVYGLGWIVSRLVEPVPPPWQHVLAWGGLRGAVSLALALTLPVAIGPDRALLQVMAFGVVVFTLLVQGMTMGPLLRRLGLVGRRSASEVEYEVRHARLTALQAAIRRLDDLHREGLLSGHTLEDVRAGLVVRAEAAAAGVREALEASPDLAAEERDTAEREALRAEREALRTLRRDGVISDEVFERLAVEIDEALGAERLPRAEGAAQAGEPPGDPSGPTGR
jgi:CPA1 family monovalent cation:H+ antiporter